MKTTLTILTALALCFSANAYGAGSSVIYAKGETQSTVVGAAIAKGATLINTETGGVLIYDENETTIPPIEAPFNINHGVRVKNYTLDGTLPTVGDNLVIDFTQTSYGYVPNWEYYLQNNAKAYASAEEEIEVDYIVFNFDDINIAEWYTEYPMTITGRFSGGVETVGYVISETCDMTDGDTTYGGIVFFNESKRSAVENAEEKTSASIPEPGTAILSLLTLAGLAARRRR